MSLFERRFAARLEAQIRAWFFNQQKTPTPSWRTEAQRTIAERWLNEVIHQMGASFTESAYIGPLGNLPGIQAWSLYRNQTLLAPLTEPLDKKLANAFHHVINVRGGRPLEFLADQRTTWTIRFLDEGREPSGMNRIDATCVADARSWHILLRTAYMGVAPVRAYLALPPARKEK